MRKANFKKYCVQKPVSGKTNQFFSGTGGLQPRLRPRWPPFDPANDFLPRHGDRVPVHRPAVRQVRPEEDNVGEHVHEHARTVYELWIFFV